MNVCSGGNSVTLERRTLVGSTPTARARKRKKVENLRKVWNETCLNAGIPSISLDKAALTCAVLLEYGNNEAFTLNDKFLADIEYIQKRYRIFGAETPDAEFAEALKEYVTKINKFEKENGHDKRPDWAEKYFMKVYNIQI
jgi:hypothetical protein